MKKIYSLLLLGGLLLFGVNFVYADYSWGWYDVSMRIGGTVTDFSAWSTSGATPTDLGDLNDLKVASINFKVWSDRNDRQGANMYFKIYDDNGQVGQTQDIWLGGATRITGDHDFSISWSTGVDLATEVGLNLTEGETYFVDVYAKTYGDGGDEWYSANSNNFHAKFTYTPDRTVTIGATGWATFSSSAARDLSSMTTSNGSVSAFYASSVNASVVTMTTAPSTIEGKQGIMLKGAPDAVITIPAATSAGSTIDGNLLVGCPTGTTVNHNDNDGWNYVLVSNNGTPEFQHIVSGTYGSVNIPAGKAYLSLASNPSGAAPSLRIIEDVNNATDIKAIDANENAVKFIENGKLFIQKNGVVYDMTGRAVR